MNSDRNNKKKVAVITGSSSGIGLETSLLLAKNGFYTYATMRNLDKSKVISNIKQKEKLSLEILQLDVNDDESVKEAIHKITNEQKRIDVLVNNAGYALVGPVEELSIEEFKEQFETNVFGTIRVTQTVLPIMRRQKNGIIINLSSIAGKTGFPLTSAYVSSKFALEGLTESMAYEIEQFGIKVILIEPGVIKTNFNNNIKIGKRVAINSNSPYGEMTQKRISRFKPRFESGTPPIEVAKVILKTITSAKNQSSSSDKLRYIVGNDALKLMEIKNNMSDEEFRKIIIKGVL
jgi:NAD(P)-dependent dehydrogenase (short-subunit alcohol dehydrogenase family)